MPFDQIDCLESALTLLEDVNHTFIIQQEDYNSVKTSLKELVSVHFIGIYIYSLFGFTIQESLYHVRLMMNTSVCNSCDEREVCGFYKVPQQLQCNKLAFCL